MTTHRIASVARFAAATLVAAGLSACGGAPTSAADEDAVEYVTASATGVTAALGTGEAQLHVVATLEPGLTVRVFDAEERLVAHLPGLHPFHADVPQGVLQHATHVAGTCFDLRCDAGPDVLACCAQALGTLITAEDPSWLPGRYAGHGL